MMGAALGGVMGHVLPGASPGVWALIGHGRGPRPGSPAPRSPPSSSPSSSPTTQNSLLALLVVATLSHLVSVLVLKRSILTEKVARRGFHVMREYSVDPLEATFVREVMDTDVFTVEPIAPLCRISTGHSAKALLNDASGSIRSSTADGELVGILPWSAVLAGPLGSGQHVQRGDDRSEGPRLPRRDTPVGSRPDGRASASV